MSKAQSLIIQFIIFFVMGFTLFLTVGTFFKVQSDTFRNDVANYSIGLTGGYISSAAVSAVDTCKQCDYVRYYLKIENTTVGNFLEIGINSTEGLTVRLVPGEKIFSSRIYNFNESFNMSGLAASVKPINLTFSRTKNELEVK